MENRQNVNIANRQLRVCRYWALGPACPNVTSHGISYCNYAHWDTGVLASPLEQKGTCLRWLRSQNCTRGATCWYEHRFTGVTGLWQDTILLTGFELHIAEAAYNSGFNTHNHEALFNLIWAVKSAAIHNLLPATHPPPAPRHPIYPDRYRPSGVGDNTNKKRKLTKTTLPNENLRLEFHPVRPLMRKHARPMVKKQKNLELIDLTSDNDDVKEAMPIKRQKITTSVATIGEDLLPGSNRRVLRSNDLAKADALIIKTLSLVKTKLQDTRKTMNHCQDTMKTLFDANAPRFDHDDIMARLQGLSNNLNKAFDGARDGAADIDLTVGWLKLNVKSEK